MYSINKHCFKEFKIAPGHRANYAILCNPEFKEKQWGMKYSPANNYQREYKILPLFSHPQIPVRYEESKGVMYKDGQSVLIQNYLILNPVTGTMALIDLECTIKIGEIICGMSKEYASPEQKEMIRSLRNGESEKSVLKKVRIDASSDLYSVGLIFYRAITGKLWQEAATPPKEINKDIPEKLNKVVLGLLEENPDNRIQTAEAMKAELEAV